MIPAMKSLDTLKIYERLKKVETFDAQARELAEILGELVDDQIATKNDLIKTESTLTADLNQTEAALTSDLKQIEATLKADLKSTEARLQVEIQRSKTEILKWIIGWVTGLIIAQTGFMLAYLTHLM